MGHRSNRYAGLWVSSACGRLRGAAVRVVGRAELLLGRIAPVVGLLLVRTGPVRTRVSGRRVLLRAAGPGARLRWRRRVPRVVCHDAVLLFLE